MKFSVFTVMTPDIRLDEILPLLKKNGYDGVEWRYKASEKDFKDEKPSFWRNNLCTIDPKASEKELLKLKQLTQSHHLETIAVIPYLEAGDLQATEKVLQSAKTMQARMIRIGVPTFNSGISIQQQLADAAYKIKQVEELCQQYEMKGLIETHHDTLTTSASLALKLAEQCNPDHIGVIYDPGNMVFEGYENHAIALQMLGPYLAHVHAKNAMHNRDSDHIGSWIRKWAKLDEGLMNWQEIISTLKDIGYEGYIGIEDFSQSFSSEKALAFNIQYLKSLY
ncbi:sugar phosphate isomerase/epimerase family protein [Alkalihalobacillus trypoxylicola]|uniref:Xylose isomerase n=1 Tax=Alkalihalobacillus trypoxylicola TaxID=519424 RepID=A0A161P442_9BACI|nr:sugar phosphate isomerase/epimerase family protein [Alkalihalobacillus trypoxylicola]KYG26585.1 xylose isomerase [Alkalihalobacillus trypoxylicola]